MAKLNIGITGNNSNIKKVIQETDALLKQLQATANAITINIGGKQLAGDIRAVTSAIRDQNKALSESASDIAKSNAEEARYRAELAKTRAELAALTLAKRQGQAATQAANGSYREAQQRLTALGRAIREAGGGFDGTNPKIKAQVEEYRRLNAQLKAFDASMGNHQRNVGNYKSALGGLKQGLESLIASYISFQAVIGAVNYAFTSSLKTDALEASLKFITGSAEQTDAAFIRLQGSADRLGLRYINLADAYKSFIGASAASNFNLVEAEKIFNSVSNAGAKLKLTNDQITGAFLALQQMISKGTVQSEELRGQLAERLPGAFAYAARAIGVTETELGKMLQRGEVLAVDLLPKLADELDKTFGNDTNEKISSLQASVNELFNSFDEAIQKGNVAKFFQKAIIDPATYAIKQLGYIFNPTSADEFVERLFSFQNADRIRGLNQGAANGIRALESSQKLLTDALANQTNIDIKQAQLAYNDLSFSLKEAKKQLDIYRKAVKEGDLNEGGQRTIAQYTKLVNDLETRLAEFNAIIPKNVIGEKVEIPDSALTSIAEIQKRITALKKLPGSAIIGDEVFNRIKALRDRLKELNGTKVRVEPEAGSFAALQKELNKLKQQADSAIVGSDTFKRIQELEKRIKVLGEIMKNPVTLSDMLKKNFEATVKALDKMDFSKLKLSGSSETSINIDSILSGNTAPDRVASNYQSIRGQMLADQDRWKKEKSLNDMVSKDFYQAFSRGVDRFGIDFYESITSLGKTRFDIENQYNQQIAQAKTKQERDSLERQKKIALQQETSFKNIFASLSNTLFSSFQQVYLGQLTNSLIGDLNKGLDNIELFGLDKQLSRTMIAAAGIFGGVLKGVISPTSTVGQGLAGGLSGAAAGVGLGASLIKGTVAGLSGGIFGAIAGGLVGIVGGIFGSSKARKQQEELQRQQLAELKKQTKLARQQALAFTSAIIGQRTNAGIITGVDRDAFGNIVATIAGRDIKLSFERETAAQARGL